MKPKYLSPLQVAKIAGQSRQWIYQMMDSKRCPFTLEEVAGRKLIVQDAKFDTWLESKKAV